jgi:hypothetical protein
MRKRALLVFLASGVIWCCHLFAQENLSPVLDIELENFFAPAPGNNAVQLKSMGANPAPAESAIDRKKYLSIAKTDDSKYTVALKKIEPVGEDQYFRYEFLVWRNSGNPETTEVLFHVTSTGRFADFFKDLPFTVIDDVNKAHGKINIPVHSLDPADACKVSASPTIPTPTKTAPLRVYLGGDTDYTVSLDCSGAASVPRLVNIGEPGRGHRGYWKKVAYESEYYGPNGPSKPLRTKPFDLLRVTMTPNVLAAVGARFRRSNIKDEPDDTIVFDVTYANQPTDLKTFMKIEIPIAFFPYIYVTAGSLLLGVVFGWSVLWVLMLCVGKPRPKKSALLLGLLLGPIAFFLVLLSYGANCRLQLFGLDVNPSDVVVLFFLGFLCACVALLKAEELLKLLNKLLDRVFAKMGPGTASGGLFALLLISLLCAPAHAADRLSLVGLSACPNGDVIGLHKDGAVIDFSGASRGSWSYAGRVSSNFNVVELACATVDDRKTAFVVALAIAPRSIWVLRMDVATGSWSKAQVASGISGGIAFDPDSSLVYLSSTRERTIYQISAALKNPVPWGSVFDRAESIGSLAVDSAGKRLLVAEAFSGIVYSLSLDSRRQGTMAEGMGSVNSLSIDRQRNLL